VEAFLLRDAKKASQVIIQDDAIDELYHQTIRTYVKEMSKNENNIENYIHLFSIAKWLERMGDHCTNVAELIIFMVKGEDVRHYPVNEMNRVLT
jgi:phosphate transport system protein